MAEIQPTKRPKSLYKLGLKKFVCFNTVIVNLVKNGHLRVLPPIVMSDIYARVRFNFPFFFVTVKSYILPQKNKTKIF